TAWTRAARSPLGSRMPPGGERGTAPSGRSRWSRILTVVSHSGGGDAHRSEECVVPDYRFINYETVDEGTIARIELNRPEARNAQNRGLLVELHEAFLRAEADDQVRVVILSGAGPMFSSGHDMGSKVAMEEYLPGPGQLATRAPNRGAGGCAENLLLQECL